MEPPSVSFFGRTFEEYTRFFALDPAALRRLAVLDVAAGPSSFTAEAALIVCRWPGRWTTGVWPRTPQVLP